MSPAEASSPFSSTTTTNTTTTADHTMSSSSNSHSNSKPVVAVDIDEVLGYFVLQLCKFHNEAYNTQLTPEAFTSYQFHEVWGGTREESDAKMRLFFESKHFLEGDQGDGIPVVDGAVEVLRKHKDKLELHVVTSRQNILKEMTEVWIAQHYSDIFAKLHFGNHHSLEGEIRSKPDLCRDIDAVMIIDDNVRYALQCANAGIRTCLFGDYAWNRSSGDLPSNIYRTLNWNDVDEALLSVVQDADAAAAAAVAAAAMEQSAPPAHENAAKGRKNEESCTGEGKEGPFESKEPTYSAGTEGQSTGGAGAGGGVKTGDLAPCAAATVTAATTSKGIVVNEDQSSGEDIRIVGGDGVVVVATSGDGVTGGVEVVMVEVSKKVPDLVEMATERLAQHEAVCLRSLEKGHSLGVDTVQELERLDIATKISIKTSLVELTSGSRTCVEITVARTPRFALERFKISAGGAGVGEGEGTGPGVALVTTGKEGGSESARSGGGAIASAAGEKDDGDGPPQLKEN